MKKVNLLGKKLLSAVLSASMVFGSVGTTSSSAWWPFSSSKSKSQINDIDFYFGSIGTTSSSKSKSQTEDIDFQTVKESNTNKTNKSSICKKIIIGAAIAAILAAGLYNKEAIINFFKSEEFKNFVKENYNSACEKTKTLFNDTYKLVFEKAKSFANSAYNTSEKVKSFANSAYNTSEKVKDYASRAYNSTSEVVKDCVNTIYNLASDSCNLITTLCKFVFKHFHTCTAAYTITNLALKFKNFFKRNNTTNANKEKNVKKNNKVKTTK